MGNKGFEREKHDILFRMLAIAVVVAIVVASAVSCVGKKGFFLDELYSYGLSNGNYAPFLSYEKENKDINNVEFTREEIFDYLTVQEGERFDYSSVYYNQSKDVHPPFFYFILHTVSSFFPEIFSKWIGLSIGIVFFALTLLMLYLLTKRLSCSRYTALFAVGLYGLSQIGLSTMLMIRMYMPLTFFTVLLAYCLVVFCQKAGVDFKAEKACVQALKPCDLVLERAEIAGASKHRGLYAFYKKHMLTFIGVVSAITLFLGMLTQYYFVFYAFFSFAGLLIVLVFHKRIKAAIILFVSGLLGMIAFVAFWPPVFNHLTADKLVSGGSAVSGLMEFSSYFEKMFIFLRQLFSGEPVVFIVSALSLIVIAIVFIAKKKQKTSFNESSMSTVSSSVCVVWLIAFPILLTVIIVSVVSPVSAVRYLYNIAPLFSCLAAVLVLYAVKSVFEAKGWFLRSCGTSPNTSQTSFRIVLSGILVISLCVTAFHTIWKTPDYTYRQFPEMDSKIGQYADAPCLYVNDQRNAPLTTDILQLAQFDNFFVSNLDDIAPVEGYVKNHKDDDELVVYITVDDFWTRAYDVDNVLSELCDLFGYTDEEKLYKFGLSVCYVLSK